MVGVAGIEPASTESKSVALPLGHTPVFTFFVNEKDIRLMRMSFSFGVDDRIRTDDPQGHNLVL